MLILGTLFFALFSGWKTYSRYYYSYYRELKMVKFLSNLVLLVPNDLLRILAEDDEDFRPMKLVSLSD